MLNALREYLPRLWCIVTHRRIWVYDAAPHGLRGLAHYWCPRCHEYYFIAKDH